VPVVRMTIAYIQAKGDGTTKTMMLSENFNATHWGYFQPPSNPVPDEKYHFGFCWEQPAAIIDSLATGGSQINFETDARFRRFNGLPDPLPETSITRDMTSNYGFPSSHHPGGSQVVFVAGQVQFVSDQIENLIYAQLMTTNHKKSDLKNGQGVLERDATVPQPSDDSF